MSVLHSDERVATNYFVVFLFTGSLLIGRTLKESGMLKRRVNKLAEAGVRAEYLCSSEVLVKEPAVMVEKEGGAAFLPDDCQLDARRAVAFIRKVPSMFSLLAITLFACTSMKSD